MEDKKVFREIFSFFVKCRGLIGHMDRAAFWSAAAQELERRDGVKGQ